jgi:hypothetical protein
MLSEVPDYSWDAGCFGTASGNLMGYWDRHGFPSFYTGPTGGGLAPLSSEGSNVGIRSMWASRAGLDGRPEGEFGHMDDYWVAYESPAPDPYVSANREEHTPDCIGDFIGLSQNKWNDLNGECEGNIDAFSFVFWDAAGSKRVNFTPASADGTAIPDIPSGLRAWTRFRGNEADAFSQLVDFNPSVPEGQGFTFDDLKAEIDAGYPVLLFLQNYAELNRSFPGMPRANPGLHGMLAYGYFISDAGEQYVRYKTSWGSSGENTLSKWNEDQWQAQLPVRGVIGYRPRPQITGMVQQGSELTVEWDGPSSVVSNLIDRTSTQVHWYVLERATQLNPANFEAVTSPAAERRATITVGPLESAAFYRVSLRPSPDQESSE